MMKRGGKCLVRFLSNSEFPSYPRCACTAGVKAVPSCRRAKAFTDVILNAKQST